MNYEEFLEQLNSRARKVPPSGAEQFKHTIAKLTRKFDGRSLDEINDEIRQAVESNNRMPRYRFAGLSSGEMSTLLYHPFEPGSPVQLRAQIKNETLDKIGFLRLVEELLKIHKRDGHIKLTDKNGALPRKTLVELYCHNFIAEAAIEDGLVHLRREEDSAVMGTLHAVACLAGLLRKTHGKLVLTKLGEKMLLPKNRRQLFEIVFSTFTTKFDWAYNDTYPNLPLCRDAFAFSIYLVAKFGDRETHKDFYGHRFLTAFPQSLDDFLDVRWGSPESALKSCYRLRTFDRFLEWFDLVDVRTHEDDGWNRLSLVKKSEVADEIFVVA